MNGNKITRRNRAVTLIFAVLPAIIAFAIVLYRLLSTPSIQFAFIPAPTRKGGNSGGVLTSLLYYALLGAVGGLILTGLSIASSVFGQVLCHFKDIVSSKVNLNETFPDESKNVLSTATISSFSVAFLAVFLLAFGLLHI